MILRTVTYTMVNSIFHGISIYASAQCLILGVTRYKSYRGERKCHAIHWREFNHNFNAVSWLALEPRASKHPSKLSRSMSWALRPIFYMGNLPRETSVTPLNTVSCGDRAIVPCVTAPNVAKTSTGYQGPRLQGPVPQGSESPKKYDALNLDCLKSRRFRKISWAFSRENCLKTKCRWGFFFFQIRQLLIVFFLRIVWFSLNCVIGDLR